MSRFHSLIQFVLAALLHAYWSRRNTNKRGKADVDIRMKERRGKLDRRRGYSPRVVDENIPQGQSAARETSRTCGYIDFFRVLSVANFLSKESRTL
jgi:hypothetical protein